MLLLLAALSHVGGVPELIRSYLHATRVTLVRTEQAR